MSAHYGSNTAEMRELKLGDHASSLFIELEQQVSHQISELLFTELTLV